MKNFRVFLYGVIRFIPSQTMGTARSAFYRSFGVKIGKDSFFSVGVKLDVWKEGVSGEIGERVFLGENSVVSGGVFFGNDVSVNTNVSISASPPTKIYIGDHCLIGQNVVIRSDDHRFDNPNELIRLQGRLGADIVIGEDSWIGANAVILKGVHLGPHTVVGAGTIVTKSFPSYSVLVGNPARLIKDRRDMYDTNR